MADGLENLPQRVEQIGQKLDGLSASVDARFEQIQHALVERRRYTEFAYDRLTSKIDDLSARMDHRFNRLERKLDQFIDLHT